MVPAPAGEWGCPKLHSQADAVLSRPSGNDRQRLTFPRSKQAVGASCRATAARPFHNNMNTGYEHNGATRAVGATPASDGWCPKALAG